MFSREIALNQVASSTVNLSGFQPIDLYVAPAYRVAVFTDIFASGCRPTSPLLGPGPTPAFRCICRTSPTVTAFVGGRTFDRYSTGPCCGTHSTTSCRRQNRSPRHRSHTVELYIIASPPERLNASANLTVPRSKSGTSPPQLDLFAARRALGSQYPGDRPPPWSASATSMPPLQHKERL